MVNNPIIPLDNFNIFQEVKKTNKGIKEKVHCLEQGKDTFEKYSFTEAVKELDELIKKESL